MLKHVETVEKSVAHIVSCCKAACQSSEALDALKFGLRSPGESLQILHIASLRHCVIASLRHESYDVVCITAQRIPRL